MICFVLFNFRVPFILLLETYFPHQTHYNYSINYTCKYELTQSVAPSDGGNKENMGPGHTVLGEGESTKTCESPTKSNYSLN